MAMSAVYTCVDGELFSEVRGGVETLYEPDTLGSLLEARDASGTKTYEARYWPYGEVKSESGTNPSPWGYVGLFGYLKDLIDLLYVRARYYRPALTRWQTVDPLWPRESEYGYVDGMSIQFVDYWGAAPCQSSGQSPIPVWPGWEWTPDRRPVVHIGKPQPLVCIPAVYGNFCGPQNCPPPPGTPPIKDGGTDSCCKAHDECFEKNGCDITSQIHSEKCKRCTAKLCSCFDAVNPSGFAEGVVNNALQEIYCRVPFTPGVYFPIIGIGPGFPFPFPGPPYRPPKKRRGTR